MDDRLSNLRHKLTEQEIDAIFVSQAENRRYLSGFAGSAGFLLITQQKAILATDFRYIEQAKIQAPDYAITRISGELASWFPALVEEAGIIKLGFEARHVTYGSYNQLNNAVNRLKSPVRLIPLEGMVEALRTIKEPAEIELITRAAEISDKAFHHIEAIIHAGMTENEAAWELEKFMRENGSEALPFEIIVASGPNAALPHIRPSQRIMQEGEPVVIDIGARVNGYSSDLSRTICPGTPDDTFKKIYDTVLGAQLTVTAIIREGITGDEADRLARTVIEEAGYGEAFGHALGHGVGLAPHELPRLGPGSKDKIANGMVFTIEPGIYLPGWGGVRIEDLFVMEGDKAKAISQARKV